MAYGNGGEYGNQIAKQTMQDPRVLGGGSVAPPTGPNVHTLLAEQEQAVEQLHNAITELEQRLSCVLAQTPQSGESARTAVPESGLVTDRLGRNGHGIGYATARIAILLGRLQL